MVARNISAIDSPRKAAPNDGEPPAETLDKAVAIIAFLMRGRGSHAAAISLRLQENHRPSEGHEQAEVEPEGSPALYSMRAPT